MNIQELKLSLFAYPRAYSSTLKPIAEILRLIQYDSLIQERTRQFRETARVMGKKHANTHIKEKLMPAFGVAVTYKGLGHSAEQANGWTGLAMCDIDHIDDPDDLEAIFARLADDPHVLLIYRTISGQGLRIIYWYQRENGHPIDDTSWRAAFYVGNEYFAQQANHEFDEACCDFTRLCGLAGDPAMVFNPDAEPFCIPDDLIVEQNCEYQEHGRPRKEYTSGTFSPEPEEAWPRVEQMLAEKSVPYSPGHHHDYVLHASYLFNRFGVDLDKLLIWASQEWADYDSKGREDAIRHKYKDESKHGTWKLSGKKRGRENAMITLPEIREWLTEHLYVCYNEVTDQLVYRERRKGQTEDGEEIPLTSSDWKVVDETMINTQRYLMAYDTGKRVLKPDVESIFKSNLAKMIHPIRQFIQRLPSWDGQDRITELANHVHAQAAEPNQSNAEAQEALLWAIHKWLVAMLATWMDDKVSNHTILTFIGPQGIYKTTFFRHLLPPPLQTYFLENAKNSFHQKDDRIALTENCMVEIEEVEAVEGKDLAELKSLVTSESIKERRPYGKFREQKPRLASFCATGNEQHILTDKTGNRRWLCFLVSVIDDPHEWNLDYEQFYAQLFYDYQNGFQYWFDTSEEKRIEKQNRPFTLVGIEEQLITTRLRKPRGNESYMLMNSTMIGLHIGGGHLSPKISIRKIGEVMRSLGYTYQHKRNGDFYRVVDIPFNDQQRHILLNLQGESAEEDKTQLPEVQELDLPF